MCPELLRNSIQVNNATTFRKLTQQILSWILCHKFHHFLPLPHLSSPMTSIACCFKHIYCFCNLVLLPFANMATAIYLSQVSLFACNSKLVFVSGNLTISSANMPKACKEVEGIVNKRKSEESKLAVHNYPILFIDTVCSMCNQFAY